MEDQGHGNQVRAIDAAGNITATVTLTGADNGPNNTDWEDIAIASGGPTGGWLYVADFGDNDYDRDNIKVHVLPEPNPNGGASSVTATTITLNFPTRSRDAEALLIDPSSGDLVVITKHLTDVATMVWRAPASPGTHELSHVATIDLSGVVPGPPLFRAITAADVSPDGRLVAIRTYPNVWIFDRVGTEPVWQTLERTPCRADTGPEGQGEALAFSHDSSGFSTLSEGTAPHHYRTVLG